MKDKIIKILENYIVDNLGEKSPKIDVESIQAIADDILNLQLLQANVVNWVAYDWNNHSTHPPKAGRYLIYRRKCDKEHFEQWNGSGWSSSNNDCTHWTKIEPPCL
jgi:hypothetical protein